MKSNFSKGISYLATLVVFVLLTGCFSGAAGEESKLTDAKKTSGASSEASAVFKENVKNFGELAFDGETVTIPNGNNVVVGDVLTFSVNGQRVAEKVVSISGNKATVTNATLEEIFSKLEINDSIDLSTANLDANSLPSGVVVENTGIAAGAFSSDSTGLKYYIADYELIDYSKFATPVQAALKAANVSVKVNGSVLLKKPTVDFSYSLFTKSVKLVINTGDVADLSIAGSANYEKMIIDKEIFLGNYVVPISAVGVPVGNLTFSLTMSAGVSGKINFSAKAYQSLDVSVGVQGKYGSNSGISFIYPSRTDIENSLKYGYDAKANGNLDAWCSLMPRASLVIFSYEMAAVRGDLGVVGHVTGAAESSAAGTTVTGNASLTASAQVYAKVEADFKPIPNEPKKTATILDWKKDFTGTWATK